MTWIRTTRNPLGPIPFLRGGAPLWFSACAGGALSCAGEVCDIDSRLEPFLDDYLIESMSGVDLKLHSPKRENVAIRFDDPWDRRNT